MRDSFAPPPEKRKFRPQELMAVAHFRLFPEYNTSINFSVVTNIDEPIACINNHSR
ncbi:hypothetical protein X777_03476 [Ooceraea biroi]|uniref:Uncharacterized protein n=1 Tax=Ooceraea biroi TaxID=2015173 RepID=A0A026WM26_OOCBI|nr:hypothetical protein X777_03476 [Ooceraea biroi]